MATMTKLSDIKFTVKFEDGTKKQMTPKEIGEMKDKRKWDVLDSKGVVILKKGFRG